MMYSDNWMTAGGGRWDREDKPSPLSLTQPKYDEEIVSESVILQWDVVTMPDGTKCEECYVVPREGHKLTYIRFRYALNARGRRSPVPCDVNAGVGRIKAEVKASAPEPTTDATPEATNGESNE
jgi:hypothetical protein